MRLYHIAAARIMIADKVGVADFIRFNSFGGLRQQATKTHKDRRGSPQACICPCKNY